MFTSLKIIQRRKDLYSLLFALLAILGIAITVIPQTVAQNHLSDYHVRGRNELQPQYKAALDQARAYLSRQEYFEAISSVNEAKALAPTDEMRYELELQRAVIFIAAGRIAAAKDLLQDLKGKGINTNIRQKARLKLYPILRLMGDLDEYIISLENKATTDPEDLEIQKELSLIYSTQKRDLAKERVVLERLRRLGPSKEVLIRLSKIYFNSNSIKKAAEVCDELAIIDPDMKAEYAYRKALIYQKAGLIAESVNVCNYTIEYPSSSARILLRVGRILRGSGQEVRALEAFRLAEKRAIHRFRRERATLEACRTMLLLGQTDLIEEILVELSVNAEAAGVRNDASLLLEDVIQN